MGKDEVGIRIGELWLVLRKLEFEMELELGKIRVRI